MEGRFKCDCGSRYVCSYFHLKLHIDHSEPGPAHAVYFATYEAVKHAMGGNKGNEHHPLAAGTPAQDAFGILAH